LYNDVSEGFTESLGQISALMILVVTVRLNTLP
jgi:hypothetical protein